ncbi:MAG: response regulator [Anaerolineae bacterium]|nr:response regulator [Anaerolineae bacterium]
MRILYVEDALLNLCLVERIARMGGHDIIHYTYAEHALEHFEEARADIALVDIRLDGPMSGIDLVMELRSAGYTLPIIAITALASNDVRDRCLAAGCTEYFTKPLPVR